MKNRVIALMLILPLLFVLVVFSAGNAASLGTHVPVTGISITEKPENDTLSLDIATYKNDFTINVEVQPANASDKSYTYRVEGVEYSEVADISVSEEGAIIVENPPKKDGTAKAKLSVVSNDGGYSDSFNVILGSSKPYDFDFSLTNTGANEKVALSDSESGYSARIDTGKYAYSTQIYPSGFTNYEVTLNSGFAIIDESAGTFLTPFSVETELKVTVKDGVKGDIEKTVALDISRAKTESGILINGGAAEIFALEESSTSFSFYVEADSRPEVLESGEVIGRVTSLTDIGLPPDCYVVEIEFKKPHIAGDFVEATIKAGENKENLTFSFAEFDFVLRSDLNISDDRAAMLLGSPATFYAFPTVDVTGITYKWTASNSAITLNTSSKEDGSICAVTADESCDFVLSVQAFKDGAGMNILAKHVTVNVIRQITAVQITNRTDVGLAGKYTIAGEKYNASGRKVSNIYSLSVTAYNVNEVVELEDTSDFIITSSNSRVAQAYGYDNKVAVAPRGTDDVTVTISWKGNEIFGTNVRSSTSFNIAASAVEVRTSEQLYTETGNGKAVVLAGDIMLGTDSQGNPLPVETRARMLGRFKSTYNIDFYKNSGREDEAYLKYAIEFKNNVYGNGYSINAGYFTNAKDASGVPLADFFRGPLVFVEMGDVASVAGQDNIAFLVRTDGVTLYNVNLLGCSDDALLSDDRSSGDLTNLNTVGTTLEIAADNVKVLNCRVRNGRNVIRAYGGNQRGDRYFIESLAENNGCDADRISVRIEGCIISQGREFLLKIGANRALRATSVVGEEPDLLDANGRAYKTQTNDYLDDDYFYHNYVLTDVTLKDSVLETSGLFSVGVESNFSGNMLYRDAPTIVIENWPGTGGTSFASILRLEGDVRIYDWKDLALVDSSTLIQTGNLGGISDYLTLNISAMLNFVCNYDPANYGNIILNAVDENQVNRQYVHGGIAFYGGGKNYSQISFDNLNESLKDFTEYDVNINVLSNSDDPNINQQGSLLPSAAGTQDFRFFMYGSDSVNSYNSQVEASANGTKYSGIKPASFNA